MESTDILSELLKISGAQSADEALDIFRREREANVGLAMESEQLRNELTAQSVRLSSLHKSLMASADRRYDDLQEQVMESKKQVIKLLAHCPDPECPECGKIMCPHNDPQHFHKAGCPSCGDGKEAA